jgi:hypothetical protein
MSSFRAFVKEMVSAKNFTSFLTSTPLYKSPKDLWHFLVSFSALLIRTKVSEKSLTAKDVPIELSKNLK